MQYNRNFITLRQERSDYNLINKECLGTVLIETRGVEGKITVSVQNLKPQILYKVCLINIKNGKSLAIHVGVIEVNARGWGSFKCSFESGNVGGSGIKISDFSVVAVLVSNKNDLIAPLVAYKNEKVMWKNNFMFFDKRAEKNVHDNKTNIDYEREIKKVAVNKAKSETVLAVNKAESEVVLAEDKAKSETVLAVNKAESEAVLAGDKAKSETVLAVNKAESEAVLAGDKAESEVVLAGNKVVSEAALAEDKEVNSYEYKPSSEIMGEITEEQKRERLRRVENKSKKLLSSNDTYKQHVSGRSSTISKEKKKNIDYVQIIKDNKSNLTRQYERDSAIDKYSSVYTSFIDAEMDSAIHKNKKKRRKTTLDNKVKESTVESDLNEGFIKLSNKFNKEIEEIKRYQIKSIGLSFIFKEHVRLNPFEESGGAVWVKISLKELALLPINISGYITNPFIIASFKKYRHLLLGAKYEEEKQMYMLGVPRTYKEQDFNKASHIGFTYFKCCREQEPVQGSYGYWINYMRI